MKNISIFKVKDNVSYIHLLKWFRSRNHELTLSASIDWVRSLPQTIGPFYDSNAQDIIDYISSFCECQLEVIENDNEMLSKAEHEALSKAEIWYRSLSDEDQKKCMLLVNAWGAAYAE